ncbi:hypothetical protein [Prochlorococcus sp. MIT 1341]|uniref:hypothetical protein n=1 Tax=Prochlorococcus sp. MIT 1341 TaxID=3096221 RepID=UPI002A74EA18|nr:hypothetical protein [Prochlorococcus sp. MIT 1341]
MNYYDELTELKVSENQTQATLYELELELKELQSHWEGLWRWDLDVERADRISELLDQISVLNGILETIQVQRRQIEVLLHLCGDD